MIMSYNRKRYNMREELLKIPPDFIKKLPQIERDIYYYYCTRKIKQQDIRKIIKISQGGISHRVSRILKRVQILEELKDFNLEEALNDLNKIFNPFEIELLRGIFETTCQSETARRLNVLFNLKGEKKMSQIKVKYRFERYLDIMKETPHFKYFNLIKDNLYSLHEVSLPHFDRR
jgi:hypothetical protein